MHICHVAFSILKSAYTPKIYLQSKTKRRNTPTQVNAQWVNTPGYCKPRLLTQPDWSCMEKILVYNCSRQGVSFRRETSVHETIQFEWDDLHASQVWVPAAVADSHMLCSHFRLPAAKASPVHAQIGVLILSFLQSCLPKHVLADTGLSLFLKSAAFWTFSL